MSVKKPEIILLFSLAVITVLFALMQIPALTQGTGSRIYSPYDSVGFYEISQASAESLIYSGKYDYVAYPAYPLYLIYFRNALETTFGEEISYELLLLSNLLLYAIFIWLIIRQFSQTNNVTPYILFAAFILEPSMLAFSLILERELFASLIVGIFVYLCLNSRQTLGGNLGIFLTIVLMMFTRAEISFIMLLSLVLAYFLNRIVWLGNEGRHAMFFVASLAILVVFSDLIASALSSVYAHLDQKDHGLGSVIFNLPLELRVITYSVLYAFLPVPIFSEISYPYQIFLSFSGLSYAFYLIYILGNLRYCDTNLTQPVIFVLIASVAIGGSLFNIRHRVQLVPALVLITMAVSYKIYQAKGERYLRNKIALAFLTALCCSVVLNLTYFFVKA